MIESSTQHKSNTIFASKLEEIFGIDLKALAFFRIAVAIVIIVDLILRSFALTAHYTDLGVLPRELFQDQFPYNWGLYPHMYTGSTAGQAILFLINGFLAFLFLIGYRTKLVSFLLWLFIVSLHARNTLICFGADMLLHVVLFWSMFLPLGACYSVDSMRKPPSSPVPKYILNLGTFAYLIQVAIVYLACTEFRVISPDWRTEGTALYYSLELDFYVRSFGKFLLQYKELVKSFTFFIYWFERIGPFFLFLPVFTGPVRTLTIFGFWLMHLGISLCLDVGYFGWVSSVAMIPFLPAWFFDKVLLKVKALGKLMIISGELYEKLISNKPFARYIEKSLPRKPFKISYSRFTNFLVAFFLSYVVLKNLSTLYPTRFLVPPQVSWIGALLWVDQQWSMFGPTIIRFDWWFVMPAKLKDGSVVDIFGEGKKVSWEKPKLVINTFKNYRWSVYLNGIVYLSTQWYTNFVNYSNYLCRSWNSKHKNKLKEFEIYLMFEYNLPDYQIGAPQKLFIWKHDCFMKPSQRLKMWETIDPNISEYISKQDYEGGITKVKEALTTAEKVFGLNSVAKLKALNILGYLYLLSGKYVEAESVYKDLIEITESSYEKDHLYVASLLFNLGYIYQAQHRNEEAKNTYEKAIPIAQKALGKDDQFVLQIKSALKQIEDYKSSPDTGGCGQINQTNIGSCGGQ